MEAWAADQKIAGSMVTFLADTGGALTKALGVEMTHAGPLRKLGNTRCKRFAMYVEDGVVKAVNVSESPDDPAGDDDISASSAEGILASI